MTRLNAIKLVLLIFSLFYSFFTSRHYWQPCLFPITAYAFLLCLSWTETKLSTQANQDDLTFVSLDLGWFLLKPVDHINWGGGGGRGGGNWWVNWNYAGGEWKCIVLGFPPQCTSSCVSRQIMQIIIAIWFLLRFLFNIFFSLVALIFISSFLLFLFFLIIFFSRKFSFFLFFFFLSFFLSFFLFK